MAQGNSQATWQPGWEGSLGEWIHVYVWLSHLALSAPETITALLLSYTPIRNESCFFKRHLLMPLYDIWLPWQPRRLPTVWETQVRSLGQEDPLEKEMAPHSSTLAWRIPWTEEPGGLQSMGSQSRTRLSDVTFTFLISHADRPAMPHLNFSLISLSLRQDSRQGELLSRTDAGQVQSPVSPAEAFAL